MQFLLTLVGSFSFAGMFMFAASFCTGGDVVDVVMFSGSAAMTLVVVALDKNNQEYQ